MAQELGVKALGLGIRAAVQEGRNHRTDRRLFDSGLWLVGEEKFGGAHALHT